jgi:hypothetical protein
VLRLVALVGVLAVLVVAAVVVSPVTVGGLPVLAGLERSLEGFGPETLLLGLVGLLSLYLLVAARGSGTAAGTDEPFDGLRESQPEAATAAESAVVGATLDGFAAAAVASGGEEYERVRARLRESTVEAYALAADVPRERAEDYVGAGDWTTDATAARFLAGAGTAAWPLTARLRLWLDPEAERERRIARTVSAMAALEGAL